MIVQVGGYEPQCIGLAWVALGFVPCPPAYGLRTYAAHGCENTLMYLISKMLQLNDVDRVFSFPCAAWECSLDRVAVRVGTRHIQDN